MSREDAARFNMTPLNTSPENLKKYVDAGIITKNEANAASKTIPWVNFANEMTKDVVVPLTFSIATGIGIKSAEINNQKISNPLETEKRNWNFKSESPYTVKNSEGNYTLGRNNEWNFNTKYNISYVETGNKGQGLVSVPSYDAVTNDYSRNYDIFYRSISKEDYGILKSTGNLKGTGETSTSPNLGFTDSYAGIQLKFYTKQGTIGEMEKIGVRGNAGSFLREKYPDMPRTSTGWGLENVQFKQEGKWNPQINIQLGKEGGKGLEIFNKNLKTYEVIKENK